MSKIAVVAGLLTDDNDALLVCQRNSRGAFPGKWEFPGGKIEGDETPEAALRRELEEELGIVAEIGEQVWSVEHQYPGHAAVLLHFFLVSRYEGTLENRVFQQIAWARAEELAHYDFLEADRALIERIAAGEVLARGPLNLKGGNLMFVVCNRIPVAKGHEAEFEQLFLERNDAQSPHPLSQFHGFIRNDILRPMKDEPYVVLTYWESLKDFEAWTNSESFREAHRGRGRSEIFAGHPHLEVHEVIKSTVGQKAAA